MSFVRYNDHISKYTPFDWLAVACSGGSRNERKSHLGFIVWNIEPPQLSFCSTVAWRHRLFGVQMAPDTGRLQRAAPAKDFYYHIKSDATALVITYTSTTVTKSCST